ncbi:23333_t:CDS:2 [Dentiscutata erythropus]|uniref:23333_t:CDS:1 n=1 Tax=Dentiscutata erythropus TaxID=1348616 RepID=A0A9N9D1G8_9GLOM|nr:23333_t:CDS:2 [Dentiscutata erythropus]
MPPHTTLQYAMPSNPTNPKLTTTTNGTTQMNTNSKPLTSTTSRPRRATSASSYIFAPSWLINLNNNNKGGPSTVLSPAYASTTECPSVKEESKGLGTLKKDGLGGIKQVKDGQEKDGNSSNTSFSRTSTIGTLPLTPIRPKASSRSTTTGEMDGIETVTKGVHGRSRSVSQAGSTISSSPTSFDRNFPTLAKKKQFPLSVDLPASNVDNMWKNSDTKSKLLSPTSTPIAEDTIHNPTIDDEPELERRMSLVPKVESGKLDGKRAIKSSVKRKTSRSLSMDSAARGPISPGLGIGTGITGNRTLGQAQHFRLNLKETVAAKNVNGVHNQGSRVVTISTPSGVKKTTRIGNGQTLTGRKLSIGGSSKFNWSNNTMGKMGHFKMMSDDDERHTVDRRDDYLQNDRDHIEEEVDEESENNIEGGKDNSDKPQVTTDVTTVESCPVDELLSSSPNSASLEREENFLRQLGWQKPYDKDADSNKWAITEEEKRLFINLVRALTGVSITGTNNILSNGEIDRAKKKWAAIKSENSKNCLAYHQHNVAKHVTFN